MNSVALQRMVDSVGAAKHHLQMRKKFSETGYTLRSNDDSALKKTNLARRKQKKVRYDTWRRTEILTARDVILENLHYSNFLGDKNGDNRSPYNTECLVNIRFCDSMRSTPAEYDSTIQQTINLTHTSHPIIYIEEDEDDECSSSVMSEEEHDDYMGCDGFEYCGYEYGREVYDREEFDLDAAQMNKQ